MPMLGHVPFVLRGGNVADFLNFNGAVTRTNRSDCSWQIVLYSNSQGPSEVFYITSRNCLILSLSIKPAKVNSNAVL